MRNKLYSKILRMFSPGKALGVFILATIAYRASAVPVTVQETGIGANEIVNMTSSTLGTHWVYAGMLNLSINGIATDGFCIDPFHWAIPGVQNYNTEPLADGAKPPGGPMGAITALKIEQLWAHYYAHDMSNQDAAGLQLAIWQLVGGVNFHLNSAPDYGAAAMLEWVDSHPEALGANLIAVTGPGQDYVIPNVPDGGMTALMLGAGLAGLAIMRSRFVAGRKAN